MAELLVAKAGGVIASHDVEAALQIEQDDDAMDRLHRNLFTELLDKRSPFGVEQAVDVTSVGRYYERFADHAVAIADTVVYLVTGVVRDAREEHLG